MESFGSLFDEDWENLSRMFSGDQDSDHFPSHGLFSSEQADHGLNFETDPSIVSSVMYECNNDSSLLINHHLASETINPNFYHYFSQEISNINGCANYDGAVSLPYPSSNIIPLPANGVCDHDSVNLFDENNNNSSLLSQVFSDDSMEEILCLKEDVNIENSVCPTLPIADQRKHTHIKRKIETPESPNVVVDEVNNEIPDKNPQKKTRVSRSDNKNKKKVQPKKKQKVNGNGNIDGENPNNKKGGGNAPTASSCSCSSEDDLNLSQEANGSALNSNWKTRASRGAATDPQSLYARKRRERINERLKILQNLVPNGTKVDISTMLEEAVHYVKFLQLQIKLLSSDDMWMYAPIAYNGMDMGLYQKLQI
ncbi:hypothetical protein L6452_39205 [Arctium lappa]|uniref:Uncharacterized protein n=1 Tax=Arctium lappa TaxID=4217 RepID=A0ACB8XRN6_ARCLA|nr:hypothetical protein L6452_39205 [Arctium lappa]